MPDLISQGFKFQFEIYGEGAYSTLLEEKVQSLGLGEYVKFKGLIEYSQISKSFDDADFFYRLWYNIVRG
ncbi:hypothetical protein GPAL_3014 [Glaciecola pallidula DSM 14239 = ACAM 615]|uniref:Uncharacterized protein n=2 Tax=Brumicola TaxID=3160924 RepID=K7A316_9ALTE|nr:hypothetical protein GPAL_3014 [Glaciecola pallidula DSM 14239 = ACAM 615]